MKLRNRMLFALTILLWGLGWSAMKMGLSRALPFTFVSHRLFVSTVFLLALNVAFKPKVPKDPKIFRQILLYSLFSTMSFVSTALGLGTYESGISSVLTYTQPIMVFALAVVFLNEAFSASRLIGIMVGFSGVAVLFLKEVGTTLSWASLLLIGGAFFWAVATIYYKLRLRHTDAQFVNFAQAATTCVIAYVASLIVEPPFQDWDLTYVTVLFHLGMGASGLGMTIWLYLLKEEDATSLAGSTLVVPVLALLIGFLFMNEDLSVTALVGAALVLTGVYLVNRNASVGKTERLGGD